MATLKGQNFRILIYNSSAEEYQVVGMATNCTVSLNSNQEQAGTKDDVGLAAKPTIVSKNWQVQVDSLSVADVGAMLTAIKNFTKFKLVWDETSTNDNQIPVLDTTFARSGDALLTDATFQFDDRTNSTKSLQFTGIGGISILTDDIPAGNVSTTGYTKGQFIRLFLGTTANPSKVIAAAKQLSLHVSVSLEDATTKDTEGDWQIQEPTELNYDISTTALVRSGDTITSAVAGNDLESFQQYFETGGTYAWQIANVSGANQRTKGSVICSGNCLVNSLQISAQNRSNATYQVALTGYGAYTVGS